MDRYDRLEIESSIHAPREGRDSALPFRAYALVIFQSTRPARGATAKRDRLPRHADRFQSTRPARGATIDAIRAASLPYIISIHAPREGRDILWGTKLTSTTTFQSTRPARGATRRLKCARRARRYFNPRAPRGARPRNPGDDYKLSAFQSTRPARGATLNKEIFAQGTEISIHAPREGRDGI